MRFIHSFVLSVESGKVERFSAKKEAMKHPPHPTFLRLYENSDSVESPLGLASVNLIILNDI